MVNIAVTAADQSSRTARSARGEKARKNLKRAALEVMDRVGYHKMRIADVTGEAGVAAGLFYHYFPDLKTLTREVLQDFVAGSLNIEDIEKDVPKGDWYLRILAHNILITRAYAERPGITRCLLQLADEDPEFSHFLRQHFIEQLGWLVNKMPRLFPRARMSEQQRLLVVYTLAGTGETLLRDYYINREPALTSASLSVEDMAELISVIFYRGLFLENPPLEKRKYTRKLERMRKSTD